MIDRIEDPGSLRVCITGQGMAVSSQLSVRPALGTTHGLTKVGGELDDLDLDVMPQEADCWPRVPRESIQLDFTPRPELQMRSMTARGEVRVKVSFGLTTSPVLAHAVSYAIEHASTTEELRSGIWEATFRIGAEERGYGELSHLLHLVGAWKATRVEVDGSVEARRSVETMLHCAREWLRSMGRCGARFASSTYPGWQIVEAQWASERRGLSRFRTEQPPYSIFVRQIEHDVLPVAERYGMGVLVWSPLCRGWLTGRYRRENFDRSPDSRAVRGAERADWLAALYDESRPEVQRKFDLVEELIRVADKASISLTRMAIAFTLAHPAVTSAIIGPRTPDQLDDLLASADVRLDAETLDAIDELVPPGTLVDEGDRGFDPWWFETQARRRA